MSHSPDAEDFVVVEWRAALDDAGVASIGVALDAQRHRGAIRAPRDTRARPRETDLAVVAPALEEHGVTLIEHGRGMDSRAGHASMVVGLALLAKAEAEDKVKRRR